MNNDKTYAIGPDDEVITQLVENYDQDLTHKLHTVILENAANVSQGLASLCVLLAQGITTDSGGGKAAEKIASMIVGASVSTYIMNLVLEQYNGDKNERKTATAH